MKIIFSQIFIQVGVKFNFSFMMYNYLQEQFNLLITPSEKFSKLYGGEYELIFNVSAKRELAITEIIGPRTSKKNRTIEFTIFLPYTTTIKEEEPNKKALEHLFQGTCEVFEKYVIDTSKLKTEQEKIIDKIMCSSEMFER